MNITCRNLVVPLVDESKVRSTEVIGLIFVTLRILKTIMPVTRVFTAVDAIKPVINSVLFQSAKVLILLYPYEIATSSQVTRGDKLKSVYQIKSRSTDPRV